MPMRGFNTEFWTDEFVQDLCAEAKTLYIYLWTNSRCNQAGLYKAGIKTIANETGIDAVRVPDLLQQLEPKVTWYKDQNLIWVKNFIKHQTRSPKFLIAVANRLKDISNNGVVQELIDYNSQKYSISIPYAYGIDKVSIPYSDTDTDTDTDTGTKKRGVVRGEKQPTSTEAKDVFDHWNTQGIVVHKRLTDDVRHVIVRTLRSCSVEEVKSAISNYAEIVHGQEYFFSYKWTLKDFLKRGIDKFTDLEVAKSNYREEKGAKVKRGRQLPETYTPTPDYPDLRG